MQREDINGGGANLYRKEDMELDTLEKERLLLVSEGGDTKPVGVQDRTHTRFLFLCCPCLALAGDLCGPQSSPSGAAKQMAAIETSSMLKLLGCFVGLQASYLTWGVMQEKIMTTQFDPTPMVPDGKFPSATFCVFSNRFLAIIVATALTVKIHGTMKLAAPLWYFSPCALSNTLSSWGQYAALKYVSFPLQVLFKSAKVIPVMLMGKALNNAVYPYTEYMEALVITSGVATFSLSKSSGPKDDNETEFFGFMMLTIYICSDAFTSQWQDRIYKKYPKQIDSYQMMFGVNCSAIVFTIMAMIVSMEIPKTIEFLSYNPSALWYNLITAITSATGQLFIFYTIKNYGPVVFTIIMTTRQMISMVISTIMFGHPLTWGSMFGAVLVFGAVFYRIDRKRREKRARSAR